MAHPYKKDADEGHARKLKAYGGQTGKEPLTHAGFPALTTDVQAGRAPLNSKEYVPPEVTARTARKKGGKVMGAQSLKRLDKAPRGKHATGARKGPVPTGTTEQVDFDVTNTFEPGKMNERSLRKSGGKAEHDDEAMDRALIKKMVKAKDLTGKSCGGSMRMKKKVGGPADNDYVGAGSVTEGGKDVETPAWSNSSSAPKEGGITSPEEATTSGRQEDRRGGSVKKRTAKADGGSLGAFSDYGVGGDKPKSSGKKGGNKETINIIIGGMPGQQQPQQGGMDPMLMAALAQAGQGGPGAPPPPATQGMPPQMPPQMMAPPPASPPGPPPGAAPGGMPMPRASGGRAEDVQVKYRKPSRKGEYPAMDFGAGGGFGRKQKIDSYGTKGPKGDSV